MFTITVPSVCHLVGQVQKYDKQGELSRATTFIRATSTPSAWPLLFVFTCRALSSSLFWVKLGWPDPIQTWTRQRTTVPAGPTGCCCCLYLRHVETRPKGCCSGGGGGEEKKDLSRSTPQGRRHGGAWGGVAPSLGLSRPLTQDECENRFYLWNIMVYLKNTVAKRIGFLALIWCCYSKHLGQSVSQSRILITSDTQTSRASGSTKCMHYAALLTKLKVWWNIFLMFNRGLDYRS